MGERSGETSGANVKIGKVSDELSKETKKKIKEGVEAAQDAFYSAAGDGEKTYPRGFNGLGGENSYVEKFRARNPRTVVCGSVAKVKYKRDETGKTAWQGPGNTADYDDKVTRETLNVTLNPDSEEETEFRFDFQADPVDETLRIAGQISVDGKELTQEEGIDFVLDMLGDATKAVEG